MKRQEEAKATKNCKKTYKGAEVDDLLVYIFKEVKTDLMFISKEYGYRDVPGGKLIL